MRMGDGHYVELFSVGQTLAEHLLCAEHYARHWEHTGNKTQCLLMKELSFGLERDKRIH